MKTKLVQDAMGTHLDWEHEGITPKMIDWFWSNMEKGFLLWHPDQHEPLTWAVPPKHGNPIGSIHIAPQTWSDGTRQNLYIRFEDLANIPAEVKEYIVYEHCVVVAGLGFGPESMKNTEPMGYRIHQWQKTDYGVVGRSSAIGMKKKEKPEEGLIWAKHCEEEIGNWGVFLPQLYNLYKVVKNTDYNPFADLTVEGKGKDLRYKYIK
ncbi:hypothetical protein FDN13_12290 [Caloramator sp. E03]|uniref:hypothetical protein n=1 Tax=Caloramator sp. E03 TaxID=2576307 RepID=UPI00111070EA|nr:hypothetical protein [Caloramator sp. E03]QCX34413.1 hypothetical protein FDN13_12290 [Caloramator sp. E03]